MADTILSGDITVNYFDDNRRKSLRWTGSAAGTQSMNGVYSAMGTLLDEPTTGDDGTCMTAETPVEYTIGIIDVNDADPWYITYECVQHLTGGALRTASWTRTPGSATGIVVVAVTSNTIVTADIGFDITHADGDAGTLLEVIEQGATDYLVIRPDSFAAGNNFDSVSGTLTCNANTATQDAASTTGEQIWANFYNVTAIDADTHVYLYQGLVSDASRARVADINVAGQDWWPEGAFDRALPIRDWKTASNPIIDAGYFTCFSRKGNTLGDSFEVSASTTSGGRNPVSLKASADGNHTTGYQSITFTAASGNWSVGNEMEGDTSGARSIITQIDTPGATQTVHYYLIGDPQTTYQTAAEGLTNNDDTGTGTKNGSAPADQGPALSSWFTNAAAPSVAHSAALFDIDDDGTNEWYAYDIDCNANPLTEVYEWLQYSLQNGQTGTAAADGIEAEQYVGPTVYLAYTGSVTGAISEGSDVTQETSGATGVVVAHDTTNKWIMLRDTRGTFATHATSHTLTDNDTAGTVEIDGSADAFNPFTDAPLGRLAGGRYFGPRGALISNWVAADENSFELIDAPGNTEITRPIAITITVTNLVGTDETTTTDDFVVGHRLTGLAGSIDKTEYSAAGGEAIGAATLVVDSAITADTAGKSAGAVLNIRDASDDNQHYRVRFSSWATSTFTFANVDVAAADAGTDTTTVVESGAFTNALRGDLVLNKTRSNAVSYVTDVPDANTVNISPAITGQTTGDAIELNACPIAINTADDVYVSLLDEYATAATASVSIVYVAPIHYRVKVSNTRNATKIERFVVDDVTSGTDRSVQTTRNQDTIHA